jgi:hypothetical protein
VAKHTRGRAGPPLLIALMVAAVAACEPSAPRQQPFGVPRSAAWANGSWADCVRDEKDEHVFACTVYTKDAKVDAKGTFTLVDADGKKSAVPREPMKFTSWDGASLSLEGGRRLIRVHASPGTSPGAP